tara:strand:- start:13 stop:336 length:324 start_codon:yes stop_codon:yes gene_type:complete
VLQAINPTCDLRPYIVFPLTDEDAIGSPIYHVRVHYSTKCVGFNPQTCDDGVSVESLHIADVERFELCGETFNQVPAAFVQLIRRKFGDDSEIEAACLKAARERIER